jgi:hypothetical protein
MSTRVENIPIFENFPDRGRFCQISTCKIAGRKHPLFPDLFQDSPKKGLPDGRYDRLNGVRVEIYPRLRRRGGQLLVITQSLLHEPALLVGLCLPEGAAEFGDVRDKQDHLLVPNCIIRKRGLF